MTKALRMTKTLRMTKAFRMTKLFRMACGKFQYITNSLFQKVTDFLK